MLLRLQPRERPLLSISLVANVAAMLITFFAFIAFFNGVLSYLGSMMGYSQLSFEASWFKFSFHFVVTLVEIALKIIVMIMKVESKKSNSCKMVRSYSVSIWRERIT